jgi:hypothetical protein
MFHKTCANPHYSASAAKDAAGDKLQESKHEAKGEAHKEAI